MSVVLWPRQEVLQLVIPQLATVGRTLNANTAINLIKRLAKQQTPEGKISFHQWLLMAKEILRWNDNCIHLFWDMLSLGTYYLSRESALHCSREEVSMELEHIAIFLVMHINDAGSPSIKSPSSTFDTMWPTMAAGAAAVMAAENEGTAFAPSSPATSPKKEASGKKLPGVGNTPLSPRSPNGGGSNSNMFVASSSPNSSPTPQSPKRGALASPTAVNPGSPISTRTPRTSAQYLHSVRQKLPIILRALGTEEDDIASESADLTMDSDLDTKEVAAVAATVAVCSQATEFTVSKRIFDSLSLVVCGGYSRDQSVPTLSSLHPLWGGHESSTDAALRTSSRDPMDTSGPGVVNSAATSAASAASGDSDEFSSIPFSELTSWLNLHISMNDLLYPVASSGSSGFAQANTLMSPSAASASTAAAAVVAATGPNQTMDAEAQIAALAAQSKPQFPIRSLPPISSLSRSSPLVINGCCTTVMHMVTSASSRTSSFRKSSRSNISMSSASYDNLHAHNVTTANTAINSSSGSAINVLEASNDSLDFVEQQQQNQMMNESFSPSSSFTGAQVLSPKSNPQSPPVVQFKRKTGDGVGDTSNQNHHHHQHLGQHHGVMHIDNLSDADLARSDLSSDPRFRDGTEFGLSGGALGRPDQVLPQLFLNYSSKAKIYLISPFYSASINYCVDSDVFIGAVFGAVIVSNCERISISCTCRKLIINNCLDCAFNVATLTTTIISGDSHGLVIGPYNTSYRNLKNHIKMAALHPLLSTEAPSANADPSIHNHNASGNNLLLASALEVKAGKALAELQGLEDEAQHSQSPNCWASLCDVNACLEAPPTTGDVTGSAIDAADADAPLLPPLPSKARLLHYEEFHPCVVPFRAEMLPFEQSPIRAPTEYMESLEQQMDGIAQIKAQLASMVNSTVERKSTNSGTDDEEKKRRYSGITSNASAAISKKFMEWLISSGNAKQVMDLIRLDTERFTGHIHHNHQHHHTPNSTTTTTTTTTLQQKAQPSP